MMPSTFKLKNPLKIAKHLKIVNPNSNVRDITINRVREIRVYLVWTRKVNPAPFTPSPSPTTTPNQYVHAPPIWPINFQLNLNVPINLEVASMFLVHPS